MSNRVGQIGYDDYGNEVDDEGISGPRKPSTVSLYVNDKYEAGDVVVSAGVRVDMFNMDDYKLNDPANPPWDETGQGVFEDQISKSIKSFSINKKKDYKKINIVDYLKILKNSDWNKEFINSAGQSFVINDKIKGRLIFLKGQLVHLILYFNNKLHFRDTYD